MNNPCNDCTLSQFESCDDIRVGDIHEKNKCNNNRNRTRVVLLTQRGKDFFMSASNQLILSEYQVPQKYSNKLSENGKDVRRRAFECLQKGYSLEKTRKEYSKLFCFKVKLYRVAKRISVYDVIRKLKQKLH